jgi:hypothetical protein
MSALFEARKGSKSHRRLSNIGWSGIDVGKELEKQGTRFALGCAELPIDFKNLSFAFGPH